MSVLKSKVSHNKSGITLMVIAIFLLFAEQVTITFNVLVLPEAEQSEDSLGT